jgi:hypothetical protein
MEGSVAEEYFGATASEAESGAAALERRSRSQMLRVLLDEALAARKAAKLA